MCGGLAEARIFPPGKAGRQTGQSVGTETQAAGGESNWWIERGSGSSSVSSRGGSSLVESAAPTVMSCVRTACTIQEAARLQTVEDLPCSESARKDA